MIGEHTYVQLFRRQAACRTWRGGHQMGMRGSAFPWIIGGARA
jgi:hypothetical protein